MTGTGDISREAGDLFRTAADFSFEDAMQRRLRYTCFGSPFLVLVKTM
jgi:hypothetical protein